MNITLDLKQKIEQGLLARARERGVSLDVYLEEIVSEQVPVATPETAANSKVPELPLLHLGVTGPLRRTDIYDDAR